MPSGKFLLALVTVPDLKTAHKLVRMAFEERLIACANLIPKVESHYQWKGKLERGTEVLMVLKTTDGKISALEKLVVTNHPYDTPEFIVLPVSRGNKRYLDWWEKSVL